MLLLAVLLGGWITVRAVLWDFPAVGPAQNVSPYAAAPTLGDPQVRDLAGAGSHPAPFEPSWAALPASSALSLPAPMHTGVSSPGTVPAQTLASGDYLSGSRQMLLARVANGGGEGRIVGPAFVRTASSEPRSPAAPLPSRWSASGWILLRGGDPSPGTAGGSAGYGGSQAGAVLNYRLLADSALRPALFVRASAAFGPRGGGDSEVAAGLALRPVPAVPVALLGEARLQHSVAGERLRPAVSLVTELPPQSLPLGMEAEVYAQAGHVGGSGSTAFFDVQAAVERPIIDIADADLRLGGGVWAGGQRGAQRLDVGPRASVRLDLGGASARLSADWRFRVAGNATPGSGAALTLSAGF